MEPKYYKVTKIDGEYAYLREYDKESKSEKNINDIFIALALLPEGTDIGTLLKSKMFSYTIID